MTSIGCRCTRCEPFSRALLIARRLLPVLSYWSSFFSFVSVADVQIVRLQRTSGPKKRISGGYCCGVPPLPIPNREVKPARADGTAPQCGRVGRRLLQGFSPSSDSRAGTGEGENSFGVYEGVNLSGAGMCRILLGGFLIVELAYICMRCDEFCGQ